MSLAGLLHFCGVFVFQFGLVLNLAQVESACVFCACLLSLPACELVLVALAVVCAFSFLYVLLSAYTTPWRL